MRVLMISTDRTLLGQAGIGDAVSRHQEYAKQVERLDILVLVRKHQESNQLAENSLVLPLYLWNLKVLAGKVHQQNRYDLVVCQDPFLTAKVGVYLKKKFGVKLIIHFHGDFLDNPYWLREQWQNRFYRRMAEYNIKFADSIRVVSEGIKQKLIKRGVLAHNIYKISTPVNLAQFAAPPVEKLSDKKNVLTVGRVVKAKDFPTLFKTAKAIYQAVPDFEWQIIGNGPLLKKFQAITKDQPYIKWLGLIDHSQLTNYYQQAKVVVLTSNNESFGKVFLEAAMSGVPAVATNTVGAQEIIKDGESGYIVPIGDWQSLAEKIIYLLNNPAIAQAMGQRAKEIISTNFDPSKNITLIISMWRQTAGSRLK